MKTFLFPNQKIPYLSILTPSTLQENLKKATYQGGSRVPFSMRNHIKFIDGKFSENEFSVMYLNILLKAKGTITPYQNGTNEHSIINVEIKTSWFAILMFFVFLFSAISNWSFYFLKEHYEFPTWISSYFSNSIPVHTIFFLCFIVFATHYSIKLFKKSLVEVMKAEEVKE